jgi:hypothetical protein
VKRQSYGSVILEIDKGMLESIRVPLPSAAVRDKIGDLVSANELRDQAWRMERDTIEELESLIEGVPCLICLDSWTDNYFVEPNKRTRRWQLWLWIVVVVIAAWLWPWPARFLQLAPTPAMKPAPSALPTK